MFNAGDRIQHYEIIQLLGKGGMGDVYLAHDAALDRRVAIKFLPEDMQKDEVARARLLREAKPPRLSTILSSARSTKRVRSGARPTSCCAED